ncbi:MAG TPA: heme-binding protein [Candidatus Eisenbacteria bacterium]|nr:heme-binding protein [Candidatus Eisenbacteria bacterium]
MSYNLLKKCIEQEAKYQFDSFTQTDAFALGQALYEESLKYEKALAIEIRMNHLTVFRLFPDGTNLNNETWLQAKANSVDMLGISTLHLFADIEATGVTLKDRRMDDSIYAGVGGGFPLIIKNVGLIGSICVSGLDHYSDHQVIIDTLENLKL